jgi:hypothetical protein
VRRDIDRAAIRDAGGCDLRFFVVGDRADEAQRGLRLEAAGQLT